MKERFLFYNYLLEVAKAYNQLIFLKFFFIFYSVFLLTAQAAKKIRLVMVSFLHAIDIHIIQLMYY